MKPIDITACRDKFDMWRLSESGGTIVIKKNGQPYFRFLNKESYEKYLSLNSQRRVVK